MYTKFTGALIIIVSSLIFAINIIKNMQSKQDKMRQWQNFFETTSSNLAYGGADIVQAMKYAAEGKPNAVSEVVHSISSNLTNGDCANISEAWTEHINKTENIDNKSCEIITEFTSNISNTDINICIKSSKDAAKRFGEYADELKVYNNQNKKIIICSAVFGGLFIVILLI